MNTTPYNTGKIKIGCHYTPPKRIWEPSRTESKLQSAMLNNQPGPDWAGLDWDGIAIIVGCAALIAAPYLVFAWRAA